MKRRCNTVTEGLRGSKRKGASDKTRPNTGVNIRALKEWLGWNSGVELTCPVSRVRNKHGMLASLFGDILRSESLRTV